MKDGTTYYQRELPHAVILPHMQRQPAPFVAMTLHCFLTALSDKAYLLVCRRHAVVQVGLGN